MQWKGIHCKDSTRWQHLSQLKASAFFSLQKNFSCYETQQLILGTGTAIWWVREPHCKLLKRKFYNLGPTSACLYHKNFTSVINTAVVCNNCICVTDSYFHPSLMFAGKARSLPLVCKV
jgi:hypothetical protein